MSNHGHVYRHVSQKFDALLEQFLMAATEHQTSSVEQQHATMCLGYCMQMSKQSEKPSRLDNNCCLHQAKVMGRQLQC